MPRDDTLVLVFAIGDGPALRPLTAARTPAALPFAGNYRLVDFPLSNALHSGLRRILVLTRHRSHSLNKHLRDGWSIFNPELGEYVTAVPPQAHGPAATWRNALDALRLHLALVRRTGARRVLLLAGDEVYRMDYAELLRFHAASGAPCTIACLPGDVPGPPGRPGVRVGAGGRIQALVPSSAPDARVPLGVIAVDVAALPQLLEAAADPGEGGGEDLAIDWLRALAGRAELATYGFGGEAGRVSADRYWRRPSDLDAWFQANMELLALEPPMDLYQQDWPIRGHQPQLPPARTVPGASCDEGVCVNSLIAGGAVVAGGGVSHSVLFPRVRVGDGAMVEQCVLLHGASVGEGARLGRCIVDKGVHIPPGCRLGPAVAEAAEGCLRTPAGVVVVGHGEGGR